MGEGNGPKKRRKDLGSLSMRGASSRDPLMRTQSIRRWMTLGFPFES